MSIYFSVRSNRFRGFVAAVSTLVAQASLQVLFLAIVLIPIGVAFAAGPGNTSRVGHAGRLERSEPLLIQGERNKVYRNLRISNPDGPCIVIQNSVNIRIINSRLGPCREQAIDAYEVDGLKVVLNSMINVGSGVHVLESQHVLVSRNKFVNAGRNMVQFDKVTGPGNRITRNRGSNRLGNTVSEDLINVYQSSGTAQSPIRVTYNRLRNGGSSKSGSGIMVGDGGGAWQLVAYNTLVNPGQAGIGVASGTHIDVIANRVYQRALPWSNVGIYVWNQYAENCSSIRIIQNEVDWRNAGGVRNGWWDSESCDRLRVRDNHFEARLSARIFKH
ncbi:MAG: right-handed parallel beta-helix repeat-containing protein [Granulosicoccus sp.]